MELTDYSASRGVLNADSYKALLNINPFGCMDVGAEDAKTKETVGRKTVGRKTVGR